MKMSTFARIVGGFTTDIQIAATATELVARFHPDWLAANPFIQVPDGTTHGAKDNGNGTYANLPPVVVALADVILAKSDFVDHCISQFGGVPRFGAVMVAAKSATDSTVGAYIEKYNSLNSVTKAQAQAFFTAVRAASLPSGAVVTVAEIAAIVANWPKG